VSEAKIEPIADERGQVVSTSASPSQEVMAILLCQNAMLRMGLKHLLAKTCFAVSETTFDQTAPSLRCPETTPALFIVDASSSSDEVVETIRHLKSQCPEARIVVMADDFDLSFVRRGHDAGVDGFCLTASSPEVLIKSLELVMLGETFLPVPLVRLMLHGMRSSDGPQLEANRAMAEPNVSGSRANSLSAREAEILGCIMGGAPNKVIARQLEVTEATVKVHVKAILRKVGAANRTQAAMWATTHLPTHDGIFLNA
jgi:two-component system nitrate/nitrite response regulator NarL